MRNVLRGSCGSLKECECGYERKRLYDTWDGGEEVHGDRGMGGEEMNWCGEMGLRKKGIR